MRDMRPRLPELQKFAEDVRADGFTSVVLLGMGGASLAPEVIHYVMGEKQGYPRFFMLDSTAPGTISAIERRINPRDTLFIVSTRSGETVETLAFYRYFRAKVHAAKGSAASENFVAITAQGSPLETLAEQEGFRRVFHHPPDVGGRFSALTYVGFVPAALIGVDLELFLERAERMAEQLSLVMPLDDNPGAWLGTVLAESCLAGRDKVTLVTSPALDSFGLWVEQLIAASTGKRGKGLVAITTEPPGRPSAYANDRLFVYLSLEGDDDAKQAHALEKLENAGHPVVRLVMPEKLDLGGEFLRWEVAVSVAASILGVNPFNEPNVWESKSGVSELLSGVRATGLLPRIDDILASDGLQLVGDQEMLLRAGFEGTLDSGLRSFLGMAHHGDYLAVMAYIPSTGEQETLIQDARISVRDRLKIATTFSYGPRLLHSTGEAFKGGPDKGLFIQITAVPRHDLPVPDEPFTFGTLIMAQADADLTAMLKLKRRVIRLHIQHDLSEGIEQVREAIKAAAATF